MGHPLCFAATYVADNRQYKFSKLAVSQASKILGLISNHKASMGCLKGEEVELYIDWVDSLGRTQVEGPIGVV